MARPRARARAARHFRFALSTGLDPAGELHWTLEHGEHTLTLLAVADFGGVLPPRRVWQHSAMHPQTLESLRYREGEGEALEDPRFETHSDPESGLVTVWQRGESARGPQVGALHDPLSLLWWLASARPPSGRAGLCGGAAWYRREDADGEATYTLRPGPASVRVRAEGSPTPLALCQPTPFGDLLAELV